jgi:phospholipid/cholesterol/gamma-HCH transport system ATP-binding protein
MIRGLRDDIGMTSILISHDIAESFKAGDNYAMLFDGVIVEAGDKESLEIQLMPSFNNSSMHAPKDR